MTNAELIARLRAASQDTSTTRPEREDPTLASFLTDAQDFLNVQMRLCRKAFTLNLSAGTGTYAVDANFVAFPKDRVQHKAGCVYWNGGNLKPTTPEQLDQDIIGWRDAAAATPSNFYLQTDDNAGTSVTRLGLYPPPSAAFVAATPSLTYYGIKCPAAIVAGALLPFDNNKIFQTLHKLLVLHSIFNMDLEDGRMGDPEVRSARWQTFMAEVEAASEIMLGSVKSHGGFKFDSEWRS